MDVARLNFSYGTQEGHARTIGLIRSVAKEFGRPIGILQDLSGPKLRVGELPDDKLELQPGTEVVLSVRGRSSLSHIPLALPQLSSPLRPGNRLLLGDGAIELTVLATTASEIRCEVKVGGTLRSHQGVNLPDAALSVRAVTAKDLDDLRFGLRQGVDWVAMSFVRKAGDLAPLRRTMQEAGRHPGLVAKIEKQEAVEHLDEIIQAADGVMVARGDLGMEVPLAQVPVLQKSIIARCNRAGKPVITATQMLESMMVSPRPTRAEVSDVANAVFDGTDAVMLSGETAAGRYPAEAARTMTRVVAEAEAAFDFTARLRESAEWPCEEVTDAISQATCGLAHDIRAAAIITATSSGYTAMMVSKHRPKTPIVAVTSDVATLSRLSLVWGVHPLLAPRGANTDELVGNALARARAAGYVAAGDCVVVTAGVPPGPGNTNLIKVEVVGRHRRHHAVAVSEAEA